MGQPEGIFGGLGSEASPSLSREDDGAAAAAIAAAAAAAAADGLVLRRRDSGGPEGASDSDAIDIRSLKSPSVEFRPSDDGMQQIRSHQGKAQRGLTCVFDAAADAASRAQNDKSGGSGLPFRQVINAACTSSSLYRLSEAFPFVEAASCICSSSSRCRFGGEGGPQHQQQRQALRTPMQEDGCPADRQQQTEKEPFSLFAAPTEAFPSSCCDRHTNSPRQEDSNSSSSIGVGSPVPKSEVLFKKCNWEAFAESLDKELDFILDELNTGGILEKMQLSLAASVSAAVFAFPKAKEARAAEASRQSASNELAACASTTSSVKLEPGVSTPSAMTAAATAAEAAAEFDEVAPSVESGGIFAVFAAVESHCTEITKKFAGMLSTMRCLPPQHQRQRHPRQQVKPYQPLPVYARGTQVPLFPYRHTAPPPPSLQQLRDRRSRLHRLGERKGSWEVREELPHVNASFSDAAWFSLGCSAGRSWRRLLRHSGATAAQQLELLRQLQGDDLVEGCFVIDTIRSDHSVSRRVAAGRPGRRDFMKALCCPRTIARGWVVRCDKDRDLMLLRLVGVEVYPCESNTPVTEESAENFGGSCVKQDIPAAPVAQKGGDTPPFAGTAYLRKRLLRAEVDIGSSGFYAALPLASIPRYEFIGGQASGCCGRFVCAGTALRVCLARTSAGAGETMRSRSTSTKGADVLAGSQRPLLDEATLNAAHAHAEASFALPEDFRNSPALQKLLQEPLGFVSALAHDAAHPQPEAADFEEIRPLRIPCGGDSREPLVWWDGGSTLLLSRLPYMLRSSGSFANPVATHRQLHAFSPLQLLGMAPPPEVHEIPALGGIASTSNGFKKRSTNDTNRMQVYTEAEAWEAVLKRLSDGSFVSFLSTTSPCEAIRCALARAEKDPAVRGGGVGRILAHQQGADWAKLRLKAGIACARRGQLDQALQMYDSALQLRPDYADALIARGAAYANKLDYERAAADLDAALALEPANKNAAKYRAIVAERIEPKEPGKASSAGDRDRTPSPDRKCKSPEHAPLRDVNASRATTVIRRSTPGSFPLVPSINALSSAAAAANAVLEQASTAAVGRGVAAMRGPAGVPDLLRSQHDQQRQHLLLLEQQKRRAELVQKQLRHSQEMERQILERQRDEHKRQQESRPHAAKVDKDKSDRGSQKKSKGKRKRKHSDSPSGCSE